MYIHLCNFLFRIEFCCLLVISCYAGACLLNQGSCSACLRCEKELLILQSHSSCFLFGQFSRLFVTVSAFDVQLRELFHSNNIYCSVLEGYINSVMRCYYLYSADERLSSN